MKRIMISGTSSGCGKTTVTCAVVQALCDRKDCPTPAVFKCGPDYIDPMFYRSITGAETRNLDRRFCPPETLNFIIRSTGAELGVVEGVMGFYDGYGEDDSSCGVSVCTGTPAVIVIDCKGMSASVGAIMKGFLTFRPNRIKGFIFNRLSAAVEDKIRTLCEELGTEYLGRMPLCTEAVIGSRHLGLVTADEITDLKARMKRLAELAEEYIDLDRLLEIAAEAEDMPAADPYNGASRNDGPVIAVAADSAFSFTYPENIELLKRMGCSVREFSPLIDESLPDNISGLILSGGYPELYADRLSANTSMLRAIKSAADRGMPIIAECGGFMYLCSSIEGSDGKEYPMAGVFSGKCFRTDKLQRFGYTELTAYGDNLLCRCGDVIRAHEFHYWDCTDIGNGFSAKRRRGQANDCVFATDTIWAGYPHIYFYGNIGAAERFVQACGRYDKKTSDV